MRRHHERGAHLFTGALEIENFTGMAIWLKQILLILTKYTRKTGTSPTDRYVDRIIRCERCTTTQS